MELTWDGWARRRLAYLLSLPKPTEDQLTEIEWLKYGLD